MRTHAGYRWALLFLVCVWWRPLTAAELDTMRLLEWEGVVQIAPSGNGPWTAAVTNQLLQAGDQLRTGPESRALLQLSDQTTLRLGPRSVIQVPAAPRSGPLELLRGLLYFFHRDKPREFPVRTPTAYAVVLGTEFNLEVDDAGGTQLALLHGEVEMTNNFGALRLQSGEMATAQPGRGPAKTAMLDSTAELIQWCLYYPAVLDLNEVGLNDSENQALAASLEAYRQGDLLGALAAYPADRQPQSNREQVYRAGLLLSVGQVDEALDLIDHIRPDEHTMRLSGALRTLIAVVRGETIKRPESGLASQYLAESYFLQAQLDLPRALRAARRAIEISPPFSFAWARVAELEFGRGRISTSLRPVEESLRLAPRNAQALALKGFLLAAQHHYGQAIDHFNQAIAIDGALGNAWLGRGLCRIKKGHTVEGRVDLQVAATLEPRRALLRSYLAKAYYETGDEAVALAEIGMARQLDEHDPTSWLYEALMLRQENQINDAIYDMERSQQLNNNRRLYRSELLLDQDRAVRGANQALLYQDAGMQDFSRREASRGLEYDYANYSAHLFLANSYQALRDLHGVNLRYETPAVSEYLLANLLAPVSAGTLAQSISQQEYSSLFERDGLGISSLTEYLSNGDWRESGAQFGRFGPFGYALGGYYRSDNGQRVNNDLEQTEVSMQFQQELTPHDILYFRAQGGHAEGGDLRQLYDPDTAIKDLRFEETQRPFLLAGYHHQWTPGNHTLALASWLKDDFKLTNPQQNTLVLDRDAAGAITDANPVSTEQKYKNELELRTIELQQIWQREVHSVTVGASYQDGDVQTDNQQLNPTPFAFPFLFPTDKQRIDSDFQRISFYGYVRVEPFETVQLIGGVSYDRLTVPADFRFAPLQKGEETEDQVSPKGGFIWTPLRTTTVRGAYARSLGGMSFDQSFRIEPTQVAGFNQAFRSLIPESVAGANSAEDFETWGLSIEQKIGKGTYLSLAGDFLKSRVDRHFGVFEFDVPTFAVSRAITLETLDFRERGVTFTVNQLIGRRWALGGQYRLAEAELDNDFEQLPGPLSPEGTQRGLLHRVQLFAIYNHPCGFFAEGESLWYGQNNYGYSGTRPGEDFWQFNAYAGYRFLQRRLEVRLGLLNLSDQDYKINPLNITAELPRDRTFMASLRLNF